MKAAGIVRRLDDLGRIVLPAELRKTRGIVDGTPLEMFVDGDGEVILRLYHPGCHACGESSSELRQVGSVHLCVKCIDAVKCG